MKRRMRWDDDEPLGCVLVLFLAVVFAMGLAAFQAAMLTALTPPHPFGSIRTDNLISRQHPP